MASTNTLNPQYGIVAMVASAGGLAALRDVLSGLPADFPAPVVIVQHLAPQFPSHLAEILSRHAALTVKQAQDGDQLQPSTVYIGPPDRHLLAQSDGTLSLVSTERVHFARPSADRLFESVAESYETRAIAVVLTGAGSDGAAGVRAVADAGGIVIAQNQATAAHFGMPGAAIETGKVDLVLPLDEIAPTLIRLIVKGTDE